MRTGRRTTRAPSVRGANIGVLLLSAATLLFEITLTRLFSVSQFYHFAFMIVSLAMLGFGASGTWLALRPRWGRRRPQLTLAVLALAYSATCLGAYLLINHLPFDSFSIAWDGTQVVILFIHYIALSTPFVFSGAVVSLCFVRRPVDAGLVYAYNLTGSAVGCVLALAIPGALGGISPVWLSGSLGGVAALAFIWGSAERRQSAVGSSRADATSHVDTDRCADSDPRLSPATRHRWWILVAGWGLVVLGVVMTALDIGVGALSLSPYKGLSYALQVPEARVVDTIWNGYSRVDLVDSPAIRSLPGLSYRFLSRIPRQQGLFVDGDDLSPVLHGADEDRAFTNYMPTAVAYQLRPGGTVAVLAPRGGLELWVAQAQRIDDLIAVEANPLVSRTADHYAGSGARILVEDPRSYVRGSGPVHDVVTLALTTPYRPVRSGAYSLGEDYAYTVEAFCDYLGILSPDGILVVSRWLQTPPSESLRAFTTAVEAVEATGGDPTTQIIAFRGYAVMTLMVKRMPFSPEETGTVRDFADSRAFDLVYAPGIRPEDVNRHSVLVSPLYYETFADLLEAEDRDAWYAAYPFDVAPPTDDHPFFGHYFRWSQAGRVLSELGKTWQPFGGAGYFVLVAMLVLSCVATLLLIGVPSLVMRARDRSDSLGAGKWRDLAYFACLGAGYLFVEIPLIQRTILFLGHPARAVTTVLFTLLFFSGVGSALSSRLRVRLPWVLGVLVTLVILTAAGLPWAFSALLPLPWGWRPAATVVLLAPLGIVMGLPFPLGLGRLGRTAPHRLPLAWAVNGAAAVVASATAALLTLSVGFTGVLIGGAALYTLALLLSFHSPAIPSPVNGTKMTPPIFSAPSSPSS